MPKLSDYINQKNENVYALKNCTLSIKIETYNINNSLNINESDEIITLPSLIAILHFDRNFINVTLDYPVIIHMNSTYQKTDEEINISYKTGELIFEVTNEDTGDLGSAMAYIDRLIGGREILKDELHLFKKIYDVYSDISSMDLVHIEVLTSQVLRYAKDISIPARLGSTWDPTLVNLKETVFNEGLVQGLAFENVGKAISNGLVNEQEKKASVLEQVLAGELVEPTLKHR